MICFKNLFYVYYFNYLKLANSSWFFSQEINFYFVSFEDDFDYFHMLGDRAFKKIKTLSVFLRSEDCSRKKGLRIIPK
jgi:hypothetical protein